MRNLKQKYTEPNDFVRSRYSKLTKSFYKYSLVAIMLFFLALSFSSCKSCKCPAYSYQNIADTNFAEHPNS